MNIAKCKEYAYIHMWYEERTKAYRENVMPSDIQVQGAEMFSLENEEYTLKKKE